MQGGRSLEGEANRETSSGWVGFTGPPVPGRQGSPEAGWRRVPQLSRVGVWDLTDPAPQASSLAPGTDSACRPPAAPAPVTASMTAQMASTTPFTTAVASPARPGSFAACGAVPASPAPGSATAIPTALPPATSLAVVGALRPQRACGGGEGRALDKDTFRRVTRLGVWTLGSSPRLHLHGGSGAH